MYIASDPVLWFRAVEANFLVQKVTKEEERAALVLGALPEKQLQSVGHLLGVGDDQEEAHGGRRSFVPEVVGAVCLNLPPPLWSRALRSSPPNYLVAGHHGHWDARLGIL